MRALEKRKRPSPLWYQWFFWRVTMASLPGSLASVRLSFRDPGLLLPALTLCSTDDEEIW
jgi:hypothetical protein